MMVNIYVQTDAKSPKRQDARAIYTIETMTSKGSADRTWLEEIEGTANEVELIGVIMAVEHLTKDCSIELYTESRFVASGIGWIPGWKQKGWKTAKGQDVAHREEWERLDELLEGKEINVHLKEDNSFRKWQQFQLKGAKR